MAWPVDEPICDDDECWPEELPATPVRAAPPAPSGLPVEIPGPLRAEEAGWCYLLVQQAVDALRRAAGVG